MGIISRDIKKLLHWMNLQITLIEWSDAILNIELVDCIMKPSSFENFNLDSSRWVGEVRLRFCRCWKINLLSENQNEFVGSSPGQYLNLLTC